MVERLHVRTALTRKNFLFAGSDAGGERAAIAFTLMACCKLAKVNPLAYLADVLPKLTTRKVRLCDVPGLLPPPGSDRTPRRSSPSSRVDRASHGAASFRIVEVMASSRKRFYLSEPALELLRRMDYPCSECVLASAKRVKGLEDEGIAFVLSGTYDDLEMLAGFVADVNHAEPGDDARTVALLYDIAESLESVL